MCGIAGIVGPGARRHEPTVERMVRALRHRGPDGHGLLTFEDCVLGHARLSIIDLAGGAQPMRSVLAPTAVTFNGEIYGYQAVRAGLREYPFRTASDTEVILALHHKHGRGLASHLPGMFAFGLWDDRRRTLLAGRDRFGEKPLYYARGPAGEFIFASEIKAVLASDLVSPRLSRAALAHYLQYLYVDPARTIYENIHVLPPAHVLEFRDGHVQVERYWSAPPADADMDEREAVEEFRRLLDLAVQRCLVADVPVGAFLSGGLDSSTIVASAGRRCGGLKTFTFGFQGGLSERPYAHEVARQYATEHHDIEEIGIDVAELLPRMQDVYDEPFADSSCIPTFVISELARRQTKVILSGDGADELLGGYSWWYRPLLDEPAPTADEPDAAGSPLARRHRRQQRYFGDQTLARLGLSAGNVDRDLERYTTNTLDDALRMDTEHYLPGDILVKIDRAAMAHGLELRAPFLDVDLASFCMSLPAAHKVERARDKAILRKAFEHDWPASIRARGKQGFGAPVADWLRQAAVRSLKERCLNHRRSALFEVLPFEATRDIAARDDDQTWILLVLALWLEKHPCAPHPSA